MVIFIFVINIQWSSYYSDGAILPQFRLWGFSLLRTEFWQIPKGKNWLTPFFYGQPFSNIARIKMIPWYKTFNKGLNKICIFSLDVIICNLFLCSLQKKPTLESLPLSSLQFLLPPCLVKYLDILHTRPRGQDGSCLVLISC